VALSESGRGAPAGPASKLSAQIGECNREQTHLACRRRRHRAVYLGVLRAALSIRQVQRALHLTGGSTGSRQARAYPLRCKEQTAGFTLSSLPSGDKQSTLMTMFVFSVQHGMLWVCNPFLPGQHTGAPLARAVVARLTVKH